MMSFRGVQFEYNLLRMPWERGGERAEIEYVVIGGEESHLAAVQAPAWGVAPAAELSSV